MSRYLLIALTEFVLIVGCSRAPQGESAADAASVDSAPDEIMLITPKDGVPVAGLGEVEKSYVDFLYALARD